MVLENYNQILKKEKLAKFQIAKKSNLLDKKIKQAFKLLENCELCERLCRVDRTKNELGTCELGNEMKISSYFDHYGEESFLIPSFTIFFWSCSFQCQFCQNYTISQRIEKPLTIKEEVLAGIIDNHSYCKNVNFVGGNPDQQLPFALKTLKFVKSNIPVVWNSNMYGTKKTMNILKDLIDIYLTDWKYFNNKCALRLSKVPNYLSIIKRNHDLAFKDAAVAIRHLMLPNHLKCCTKPLLKYLSEKYKDKIILNLMDQYYPSYKAFNYEEINRRLKPEEFLEAHNYAVKLGLNLD